LASRNSPPAVVGVRLPLNRRDLFGLIGVGCVAAVGIGVGFGVAFGFASGAESAAAAAAAAAATSHDDSGWFGSGFFCFRNEGPRRRVCSGGALLK